MTGDYNVQRTIDGIIDKIFLRFIPHCITPNQVTVVRFVLVPIICYLFATDHFIWGLIMFVVAACTDFIDGAMARTRDQITDLGKVIDPIADKLLILSAMIFMGFQYLIVKVFVAFIVVELVAIFFDRALALRINKVAGANVYGKVKMILQCIGIGLLILGIIIKSNPVIDISEKMLFVALILAFLSAAEQLRVRVKKRREA